MAESCLGKKSKLLFVLILCLMSLTCVSTLKISPPSFTFSLKPNLFLLVDWSGLENILVNIY